MDNNKAERDEKQHAPQYLDPALGAPAQLFADHVNSNMGVVDVPDAQAEHEQNRMEVPFKLLQF